jgi:monoterpene epsilon-lactone hydrolase
MAQAKLSTPIKTSGRLSYRLRSVLNLLGSSAAVSIRRLIHGPLLPGWTWTLEVGTHFLRRQTKTAFDMHNMQAAREYENSLIFASPAITRVIIEPTSFPRRNGKNLGDENVAQIQGHWFTPVEATPQAVMLYLHGGGYAYYSKFHANLIALVTLAAECRTFALDYRLVPEYPFPAQLDDAIETYRWLLESGVSPDRLVVAGDSAGGNLALALLLALREAQTPLPALAVCISPWTDIGNSGESMENNQCYDWPQKHMPEKWAKWLCDGSNPQNPLISPIHADLHGLPHIFIQAGESEILFDMIRQFADTAKKQGGDLALEVWENMNHDFQAYGDNIPQSRAALSHIGRVVRHHILGLPEEIDTEQFKL